MNNFDDAQESILNFWFGSVKSRNYGQYRQEWFTKNLAFDQEIIDRFFSIYELAIKGYLAVWENTAFGCLALIIVLDQFPRNMFRNTPRSFASDDQALRVAKLAITQGFDSELLPAQRWFIYLPFEHSESLENQNMSVYLFQQLIDDPSSQLAIDSALQHRSIIEKFGRFPHRNKILGRVSTPEEEEFLKEPMSSF